MKEHVMTNPTRRGLIATTGAAAGLLAAPARAQAQWPDRAVRIVVPFAPGGSTDIVARILAAGLQEKFGQGFVVENRPGAGGTLAGALVAQAPNDGTTLIVSNSATNGISPSLFKNIRYDPMTDFEHVALAATTSTAVVVHPAYPAQSVAALVALGKTRPDGLDFAISGHGTSTHLLGMRFALAAGIRLNPIPYRGAGPALADVINGTVGLFFDGLPSSIPHLRAGTLKAIAVADPQRNRFLPDVPTLIESGFPGMTSYSWFGISAPRGTPAPIVERLNLAIREILKQPAVQARYTQLTADASDFTPAQFTAFIRDDLATWAEVVRATGTTIEQ
jgi:tripartite-type tricarboxylate transporter receptor subunit TctC